MTYVFIPFSSFFFFDKLLSIYFQKIKLLHVSIIINIDLFGRVYVYLHDQSEMNALTKKYDNEYDYVVFRVTIFPLFLPFFSFSMKHKYCEMLP